jgi:hypothetical protein
MDKQLWLSLSVIAGVILVCNLFGTKDDTILSTAKLNFEGSANMPEHLKPPQLLFDGDSIIVTERPVSNNNLGLKMNFL